MERVDNQTGSSGRPLVLPSGWEERQDANGRTFYVNHQDRSTQWEHPALAGPRGRGSRLSASSSSGSRSIDGAAALGFSAATSAGEQFNRRHHISQDDNGEQEADSSVAADTDEVVAQLGRQSMGASAESAADGAGAPADPTVSPLPAGWTMKKAPNGRVFFIDHARKTTSWTDPRTGRPSPTVGGSRKRLLLLDIFS